MTTTLIRGKWVICRALDRDRAEIIEHGAVLVRDGMVVEVGGFEDLVRRHPQADMLGSDQHVVMPGFVNAHHHVGLTPLQLGSPDLPLELWFGSRLAARPVDLHLDTLYSAFEMVESGITTVQHLQGRLPPPLDSMVAGASDTLRAYQDIGMRVSYAHTIRDQNLLVYEADQDFLARLPPDLARDLAPMLARQLVPLEDNFSLFDALRAKFADDPRISIQVSPANLHWCSDAALERVRQVCEATGVPHHIHLLETQYQKEYAHRRAGMGALAQLDRAGLLGPHCTLGHGVWLTEAEVERVAETGTRICHNCSSNLRLRSGVAALNHWEKRGVRVAIGIDEAGLNDDRDMLVEMRMVLRQHRTPGMDPEDVPTPAQVFRMATEHGAATTGFGESIGRLVPGARADVVLLDWRQLAYPFLDEDTDVLSAVVQRAKTGGVETVMVEGEVIYRDRRFTRVDKDAALAELAARTGRPRTPEEELRRSVSRRVAPYMRDFYRGYLPDAAPTPFYATSARK
ncbi:amidohydrolase family protein [Roseococcus suduntuyensis]|uniref:Cytosine/adenosine deaminase-related metal-dependent hydrolase n=1 Tax=Roseococcus suduntuyensis TaxID=455361 RepID=A0A840A9M1_9PROT|nr:amidohydrolase family protein [Roseococcus suduntuyensis]MBB3898199.1 cytosine/adenosine deaminase-related metal-dependent hydrolase [Roseococcus suduntuyensis]